MISYESSKLYVKIWRHRWYFYAIFLYILDFIKNPNINLILDYIIDDETDEEDRKKLRQTWKDIKKHVELTKMSKYS